MHRAEGLRLKLLCREKNAKQAPNLKGAVPAAMEVETVLALGLLFVRDRDWKEGLTWW